MNKAVHTAAGAIPFVALTILRPTGMDIGDVTIIPAISLVASIVASPLPDLDMKPMHYTRGKKGIARGVASVKSKVVNKATGGHRGLTHTLVFPLLFLAAMIFCDSSMSGTPGVLNFIISILFGLLSGWLLHIFADAFNGKGVPVFWPLLQQRVHIMDIPSSGVAPWIWLVLYSGLTIFLLSKVIL